MNHSTSTGEYRQSTREGTLRLRVSTQSGHEDLHCNQTTEREDIPAVSGKAKSKAKAFLHPPGYGEPSYWMHDLLGRLAVEIVVISRYLGYTSMVLPVRMASVS